MVYSENPLKADKQTTTEELRATLNSLAEGAGVARYRAVAIPFSVDGIHYSSRCFADRSCLRLRRNYMTGYTILHALLFSGLGEGLVLACVGIIM